MSKYHQEGQKIAGSLKDEDMDLVEQYAQTQVAAFATELEGVSRSHFACMHTVTAKTVVPFWKGGKMQGIR
jgi:hypothetical protein